MTTGAADELVVSQPEFGRRLHECRQRRGLSQRALAGTHVTASYISLLEVGQRVPTLNVVLTLARALDVPPEELLGPGVLPPSGESPDSVLLAQVRARDARDLGDHANATAALAEAIEHARAIRNADLVFQLGLSLQDELGAAARTEERLALLDELLALPVADGSAPARLSLLTARASALRDLGRVADARRSAESALRLTDDPAVVGGAEHVRLLGVLISVLCELGALDEVEPRVTELLVLATALDVPAVLGMAQWAAATAFAVLGRPDDAYANLRAALDHLPYPTMPVGDWLRFCRVAMSILLDIGRDLDLAGELGRMAEAAGRTATPGLEYAALLTLRARHQILAGDIEAAQDTYRRLEAATLSDVDEGSATAAQLHAGRAEVLRGLGRTEEAADELRAAAQRYEHQGSYQLAMRMWRAVDELARA